MEKAGFKAGDVITGINGVAVATRDELMAYLKENPLSDKAITVSFLRDGTENTVSVTPELSGQGYDLGLSLDGSIVKVSGLDVIKYSYIEVKYSIVSTIDSIGLLIRQKVSADELAGPVGIVGMIGDIVQGTKDSGLTAVFLSLASFSILLSANLGVMNLLPIPALDGGRLVFLLIEVFRGKPMDQTKEGIVHMIGFIALMILMVFVVFNDLSRIF